LVAVSEIAVNLAQGSDVELRIDELGRTPTVTLSSSDSLEKAAISMADPRTPLLPVVDPKSGRFTAIVTRRDVLDAYRRVADASILGV
jgi:CBS domain-containing protein